MKIAGASALAFGIGGLSTFRGLSNGQETYAVHQLPSQARTKVYKIGATYYAEKNDGTLISASGTFETVLQAALNLQGLVTIDQDSSFQLNSAGVTFTDNTSLIMGPNTRILPPSTSLDVYVECSYHSGHPVGLYE